VINEAIRTIIDLLKLQKEAKKTDLEIERLEREKAKAKSLIEIASFEDIRKYDPRVKELEQIVIKGNYNSMPRPESRSSGWLLWFFIVAIAIIIAYSLYRYLN
jgi:hypothetical protein